MRKVILLIVTITLLAGLPVWAQKPLPDLSTDRLIVSRPEGVISLQVPLGWQFFNPGEDDTIDYATMSNLQDPALEGVQSQVQIIFRPLDELAVNVDTSLPNPGLAYLHAYRREMGLQQFGAYTEPVEIRDGFFRAGVMLYVEQQFSQRFGAGETLSLALASYLGDDLMAIILMDGPVQEWVALLSLWNYLIETLEWNSRPVSLPGFAQQLIAFEPPEALLDRYVRGDTIPENINEIINLNAPDTVTLPVGAAPLTFPIIPGWTQVTETDYLLELEAPDQTGRLTLDTQPVEERTVQSLYQIPQDALLDILEENPEMTLNGDTLGFEWGAHPTVIALVSLPDEKIAYLAVSHVEDHLLVMQLEMQVAFAEPLIREFMSSLQYVEINNRPLAVENFWATLAQLAEPE